MHWGLALVLLGVNALDLCWLQRYLGSLLHVAYRKYVRMRHQYKCNAWGAKSDILHDHVQLNHIYPYHFQYFSSLITTRKFNNMHYTHLNSHSEFLQVLNSAIKH
jgi:hypothetical protein